MSWGDFKSWIQENVFDPVSEGVDSLGDELSKSGISLESGKGLLSGIGDTITTIYNDVKSGAETVYADGKDVAGWYGDQAEKVIDLPGQALDAGKEIITKGEEALFNPLTMLAIGGVAIAGLILLK